MRILVDASAVTLQCLVESTHVIYHSKIRGVRIVEVADARYRCVVGEVHRLSEDDETLTPAGLKPSNIRLISTFDLHEYSVD